jgi:hypothetical protein
VTKPTKIALGIAVAAACMAGGALAADGLVRAVLAWTALACAVAAAAYVANRPGWLGKRRGALGLRALAVLPYLVAFRIACALMRRARGADRPTRVAPGLWVGGRVANRDLPAAVVWVVDLVAEYGADPAVRALPYYRSLPVLDGGIPASEAEALALVAELAVVCDDVLVHCDSGRGRAPTLAAAILVARGDADDEIAAIAAIRRARPVAAPTRSDLAFLARLVPALRALAEGRRLPTGREARAD